MSCATKQNTDGKWTHETFAERALTGTWVVDEVIHSLQTGYEFIEIFQIYEYAVNRYDPQTGQGCRFFDNIDTFSKLKTEVSTYPDWVRTPDEEDLFVDNSYASEWILLDIEAISPNAAKRGLAKFCLNSKWGKLTERNNRTKS